MLDSLIEQKEPGSVNISKLPMMKELVMSHLNNLSHL